MVKLFFRNISRNVRTIFIPRSLLWHALAIALTAALVFSGADWWYYEHTRSVLFDWVVFGAGIGGFFVPVLVPLGLYIWGDVAKKESLMHLGAATGQASLLGYLLSVFYKIFAGRTQPEFLTTLSHTDITHAFHFGILQNGVFWGWPSSHAATAFAGAVALALLVRNKPLRIIALVYAIFVGLGASIGFHWLSDVIAGAIFGSLVGIIVARSFSAGS
jgi:membrane-associated phospholipid phosphatase